MPRWPRKSRTSIQSQLSEQRPQPSSELIDSITRDVREARSARPASGFRVGLAAAATTATLVVFASLGGVSLAADGVQSALSVATGGTQIQSQNTPAGTNGAQCAVDVPCGFGVNPTATNNHMDASQTNADANNKVHITPGSFNQAVTLSYIVTNTCGGSTSGITVNFADNPIPAGQDSTTFTITTSNAADGVYTITVSGTSGSETESGTFGLVVGSSNEC